MHVGIHMNKRQLCILLRYYWVIFYNIAILKFVNWLLDESRLLNFWLFFSQIFTWVYIFIAFGWLSRNSNARSHNYIYLTLYNGVILFYKVSVHLTFPLAVDEKFKRPRILIATYFSVFFFSLHPLMSWEQRNMNTVRNTVSLEVHMAVFNFHHSCPCVVRSCCVLISIFPAGPIGVCLIVCLLPIYKCVQNFCPFWIRLLVILDKGTLLDMILKSASDLVACHFIF